MAFEEIIAAAKRITKEDLITYLTAKGARPECPTCSKNSWEVIDPIAVGLTQIPLQKGDNYVMPPPSLPALTMICQNCGFVRHHAAMFVAAWKLEKGK